jgi:ornithine decarboxylase
MKTNRVTLSPTAEAKVYQALIKQHGTPLMVLNCQTLADQCRQLQEALPGVELFYAIKSLPHHKTLMTLHQAGVGFDLASTGEIELVKQVGGAPRRTIHTHPIKRDTDIRAALRFGCTSFVVDNADEILKFAAYRRRVGLLLRVAFRNATAVVDLSRKFGCDLAEVPYLMALARKLELHIKGFSFHVGSQCEDARRHAEAIDVCNRLIRQYADQGAAPQSILDIGGGFPVDYGASVTSIDAFCAPIRQAMKHLPPFVHVIAEPGRYLSAPCMKTIATVVGRAVRDGRHWYYLDEGVYGAFSGQIYDHARYPLEIFSDRGERYPSIIAGPTCDSVDVIAEDVPLPELHLGDLVIGHMMGAYTAASASNFNSLPKCLIVVLSAPLGDIQRRNPAAPSMRDIIIR